MRLPCGIAWESHLRLAEKGKDATSCPTTLASYAARAVTSGQRVTGQETVKEVLPLLGQRRQHLLDCLLAGHPLAAGHGAGGVGGEGGRTRGGVLAFLRQSQVRFPGDSTGQSHLISLKI